MLKVENVLVVGLGEIGAPLLEIVKGVYHAEGLDVEPQNLLGPFDIMHVCLPYTDDFVKITSNYITKFRPKLTLIESTVLPFTTDNIFKNVQKAVCHSPVRGRKADGFKWAYYSYTKFIGPAKPKFGKMAEEYYQSLGFKTYLCPSPLETEFMKILNTTYFGLLIAWFQEIHRICRRYNLKEKDIMNFFQTNEKDSGGKYSRPVFYPGIIRGHCVIPNAQLLNQVFRSTFVKTILESNERRKKEVESE